MKNWFLHSRAIQGVLTILIHCRRSQARFTIKFQFQSSRTLKIQLWHLLIQDIIIQFDDTISFVWFLAMQNNQENMLNMHELSNTILDRKGKLWFCKGRFFELWYWNLIAKRSWHFLQCIRKVKTTWISLECKNQCSLFLEILEIVWGLSVAFFTSPRSG